MRHSIYILLFTLFPIFSFGQQWKTFTDTAGMFTAKYPSTWINKVKEGNRVFFTSPPDTASDDFFENINIRVTYKAGYGTEIKVRNLFPEIIFSGYNKLDESLRVVTTQWYCFFKSRLYLVTFVADANKNDHTETARKIMSSILFKQLPDSYQKPIPFSFF